MGVIFNTDYPNITSLSILPQQNLTALVVYSFTHKKRKIIIEKKILDDQIEKG